MNVQNTYDQEVVRKVDVIVCGAEPEGIAAAVAASREGLKTLLIDKRSYPGGLYTSGMLTMLDLNYDGGEGTLPIVNQGLFARMYQSIGRGGAIDVEQTKKYFSNLLNNYSVETLYNVSDIETVMSEGSVEEVSFKQKDKKLKVQASYVIDAMQDAPIARQSGADYWLGREDLGLSEYACSTLVFSVKGVDWSEVREYLAKVHERRSGSNQNVAWGYWNLLKYNPVTSTSQYQLRGLNLARQNDGSVVINAFQIFNIDSASEISRSQGYEKAKREIPYIVKYLREKAVGFEKAELVKIADELYIREGVRIVGEETLTAEDCFSSKNFPNKIAYGSYPMDMQSVKRDNAGGNGLCGRNVYTIPLGVMLPKKINNMLVVGRSASYDSIAHSSARTVPVGVALGEAAGEACALALKKKVSLKQINSNAEYYKLLQNNLIKQGVTLNASIKANHDEMKNWSYSAIQNLRNQGLLSRDENGTTGYGCNELASYATFGRIASLAQFHSTLPMKSLGDMGKTNALPITPDKIVLIINKILGTNYTDLKTVYEKGILQKTTFHNIQNSKQIYKSQAYVIMNDVVNYLRKDTPLPDAKSIIHNDVE